MPKTRQNTNQEKPNEGTEETTVPPGEISEAQAMGAADVQPDSGSNAPGSHGSDHGGDSEHESEEESEHGDSDLLNEKSLQEIQHVLDASLFEKTIEKIGTDVASQGKSVDIIRQVLHDNTSVLGRMNKTIMSSFQGVKTKVSEVCDTLNNHVADQEIFVRKNTANCHRILDGQAESRGNLGKLLEMNEFQSEQTHGLSKDSNSKLDRLLEISENQSDRNEEMLSDNNSKIAQALGQIMGSVTSSLVDGVKDSIVTELETNLLPRMVSEIVAKLKGDVVLPELTSVNSEGKGVLKNTLTSDDNGSKKSPNKTVRKTTVVLSDSESDGEDHVSVCSVNSRQTTSASVLTHVSKSGVRRRLKLPTYNGVKEEWEIWYNRFDDVTNRHGMSESDKLDELLPRLEGKAGDFVYGQLNASVRGNYTKLVAELTSRFKKIECSKSYGQQFARRCQNKTETPEAFSVELKRLYDKAYPGRVSEVRDEDLTRRFFDGLLDPQLKANVEFFGQPENLDKAVALVVNYAETLKRSNLPSSTGGLKKHPHVEDNVAVLSDSDNDSEITAAKVTRANRKLFIPESAKSSSQNNGPGNPFTEEQKKTFDQLISNIVSEQLEIHRKSENAMVNMPNTCSQDELIIHSGNYQTNNGKAKPSLPTCWICGDVGHIAKFCEAYHERIRTVPSFVNQMHTGNDQIGRPPWNNSYHGNNGNPKLGTPYVDQRTCWRCGIIGHIAQYCDDYHQMLNSLPSLNEVRTSGNAPLNANAMPFYK